MPCGSRSRTRTSRPCRASAAARLTVVVVLPTPPFWLATVRIRVWLGAGSGSPTRPASTRRAVSAARAMGVSSVSAIPSPGSSVTAISSAVEAPPRRPSCPRTSSGGLSTVRVSRETAGSAGRVAGAEVSRETSAGALQVIRIGASRTRPSGHGLTAAATLRRRRVVRLGVGGSGWFLAGPAGPDWLGGAGPPQAAGGPVVDLDALVVAGRRWPAQPRVPRLDGRRGRHTGVLSSDHAGQITWSDHRADPARSRLRTRPADRTANPGRPYGPLRPTRQATGGSAPAGRAAPGTHRRFGTDSSRYRALRPQR